MSTCNNLKTQLLQLQAQKKELAILIPQIPNTTVKDYKDHKAKKDQAWKLKAEMEKTIREIREKMPNLSYKGLTNWLKVNNLEKHLEGGSLEAQISKQEEFYKSFYGLRLTAVRLK